MLERNVRLEIDRAYADLKADLVRKGCSIISEEQPRRILFRQGSIWGMSPKTAKKTVEVNLVQVDSGTQVIYFSRLCSDWKNLALVGCGLAAVLVGLCLWISFDLDTFIVVQKPSFWSWIVTANGHVDYQLGRAFVVLTEALAVFLSVIIVFEIVIVFYAHAKIDRFVQETINSFLR